jgi:hypothetical protein
VPATFFFARFAKKRASGCGAPTTSFFVLASLAPHPSSRRYADALSYNANVNWGIKNSDRWLSLRLESIGNLLVLAVSLVSVCSTAGQAKTGVVISQALGMVGLMNWSVRCATEAEQVSGARTTAGPRGSKPESLPARVRSKRKRRWLLAREQATLVWLKFNTRAVLAVPYQRAAVRGHRDAPAAAPSSR